jgi:hypothetical protein
MNQNTRSVIITAPAFVWKQRYETEWAEFKKKRKKEFK